MGYQGIDFTSTTDFREWAKEDLSRHSARQISQCGSGIGSDAGSQSPER